jgi:hypothetical protein
MTESIIVSEVYPSRFLRGVDLPGEGWLVTISDVALEELSDFDGGKKDKIVLAFHELDKEAALNRTQSRTLQDYYGSDASQWVGKAVVIAPERLKNGQTTIRFARGRPQAPAQPKRAATLPTPPPAAPATPTPPEEPPAQPVEDLKPPPPEDGEAELPM